MGYRIMGLHEKSIKRISQLSVTSNILILLQSFAQTNCTVLMPLPLHVLTYSQKPNLDRQSEKFCVGHIFEFL
jgi:hypothetical protein